MKKLLSLMAAMAITAIGASAQIEQKMVRGVVLDTNGNPIAGAEVSAPGGGASAITDADGSFSMSVSPYLKTLTATYTGMGSKKMKVKFDQDMVFNMKTAWKTRGFISLIGNVNYNDWEYTLGGGGGLMGGVLGKWGAYGKFVYNNEKDMTATVGVIKGIIPSVYLYLGVGYGSIWAEVFDYSYPIDYYDDYDEYYTSGTYWVSIYNYKRLSCFACDFGVIIKPAKHFGFSVGFTGAFSIDGPFRVGGDIGVSYIF